MRKPYSYLVIGLLFTFTSACSQSEAESTAREGSANRQARGPTSLPDFVSLAKDLQPAVVNVSAMLSPSDGGGAQGAPPQYPEDEMLGKLFGMPAPDGPAQRSQGSGFIIGANGVILTNAHVIEGAKKITVKLLDKREFAADIVGKDPHTDIALIKISAKENLPTLKLGDSDTLQVGEWVMAVGNPFGLDSSVSSGIISAKGRHLGEAYDRLIQTDASLNPGSSGGPLINVDGQVVGISKAIVSQGGGNLGISFATPINLIKEILPQLESRGKVTRGWAGLAIQEITPALADTLGLEKPGGALVAAIVQGGPAEQGGVKIGDIITEFDGKKVSDALELPLWIARMPVDKRVSVMVRREQQEVKLNVTVAALPEGPAQTPPGKTG